MSKNQISLELFAGQRQEYSRLPFSLTKQASVDTGTAMNQPRMCPQGGPAKQLPAPGFTSVTGNLHENVTVYLFLGF